MQGVFLRKYGVETTINFQLFGIDGVDFKVDAVDGGTDCTIMKDEGADATCTNDFVDEGIGYSLTLTATEMQAARIVVYIVDAATKVYLDTALVIETYGHASAMHIFDLSVATQNVNISTISNNAITAAAINTDAITAAKVAADAISKIQSGITPSHVKIAIEAAGSSLARILADTNELQTDDIPTSLAALNTLLTFVKNVTEADVSIDKSGTPYQLVVKIKGTDTELIRKDIADVDGNDLASTATVIGRLTEPAE